MNRSVQESEIAAAVYPPGMRTGNQVCADFSDPAIADNNIRMKQRSGAFRRDQSDIFITSDPINNALRVRRAPNIQDDECRQCLR